MSEIEQHPSPRVSDPAVASGPSRALSITFVALSAVALAAYFAAPERVAGIQRVLEWLRAWVQ